MTTIEQIVEMERILLQAMLTSDVKKLDRLISDDLIFTDHTGQVISKMTDIEAHRSGKINIDSIEPREQIIKTFKDTAVVSVLMKIKGQYSGQPFEGKNRYSRVWINVDDSWKIVTGHATLVQQTNE